jgi:site-specific recombinase XerC
MESAATAHHDHLFLEIIRIRNHAIRALMTEHGLELHQIMNVTLSDIDLAEKRLGIEQHSGSTSRYVALSNATAAALAHYLRVRSPSREKKLFLSEQTADRSCSLTRTFEWQSFS